ncbi:P-loop containing nucleoside triphosphate hydrolase protein [Chaetomium fimeti]|uniref:P-loop containing nucleoside triphosphate hydrolase protein n=1 Tax=Chaetomium fimeti TaxID=1854472 RepID=A0AAE0HHZ8_9PEZI|nr:P-loop containing nucleoside triphosphate hydrolase protein [Chaetomium fimeti]
MAQTAKIPDDDSTASSVDRTPSSNTNTLGKRKPTADFEGKVTWTDDDSDHGAEDLKRQRSAKRRAISKGKQPARKSAAGRTKGSNKKRASDLRAWVNDVDESSAQEEFAGASVPGYLLQRRKRFDRDRERLRDAGLKLPPDYSDIYFSDDDDNGGATERLGERPQFEDRTGVKPCRPYEDIELEYSAGVIPASIAQYLRDYQIAGVKFLHQRFVYQKGCILGDDMGLGKTVQVAAFLTAAFGKTAGERDAKLMRKMRRAGDQWYPRVLIVCPGSLIQNWKNELKLWGYWHVDTYHGPGKEDVLQAAKAGRLEIMITTYVTYKKMREAVNEVEWDCVVADECHILKDRRSETTQAMDCVNALCRIGLTGTAIQNKYEELWTLLNWTNPGHFGTLAEWSNTITKPLTVGQSHDATLKQLSVARTTAKKLVQNLLPEFFLRRMKTLIAHQLPRKSDKVVFCPLTDIQREAYQNFLEGDHVTFVNSASELCDCGSGRKRGWCCRKTLPDGKSWMSVVFPSIMTLQKIANHITLLIPSSADPNDKQNSELNALQTCVPDDWKELYRNRDSMLNLANPEFCGKWKILKKLLRFWHENGDKVLVFSHSVRLLRILQHLFHNTSYNVSFLDGTLSYEDRQKVVDDFNSDPSQFVFLISTKAGGVGLNITSANKVVIFDPHWNPSYDLQAQDRAYRIGQVRDVDVFRLVSAGTIEEIVYARQIYKQQQANIGYNASNERRYFKGVQQDSNRKGEIFGLSNLFSFHGDQVVLREIVNKTNIAEAKAGVHLSDIDLAKMAKADEANPEDEDDDELSLIKPEPNDNDNDDEQGMSQLAKLITAENREDLVRAHRATKPRSDAIAGILASAGVEYTHENSEVIGTSRVEAQLSRRAELAGHGPDQEPTADGADDSVLFADSQGGDAHLPSATTTETTAALDGSNPWRMHNRFNPPVEIMRRQFCSMAREFGFRDVTEFALVVESWTQEQRRNCLDTFYRVREVKVLEGELKRVVKGEGVVVKGEGTGTTSGAEGGGDGGVVKKEVGGVAATKDEGGGDNKVKGERMDSPVRLSPLLDVKMEGEGSPAQFETGKVRAGMEKTEQTKTEKTETVKVEITRVPTIFLSDDDEDDEL